jgi:hypothetical protein
MTDELILLYRTKAEALGAYRELVAKGIPREQLSLSESRALGPLSFVSEGRKGALLGAASGVALAGTTAFVVSLVAGATADQSLGVAGVAALIGAGVGAFIGGVAGLEADQPEGLDFVEPLFQEGFALDAELGGRNDERMVLGVAKNTHAALAMREV